MSHPEVPSTDKAIANQLKIVELLQQQAIADPVNVELAQALNYHVSNLSLLWSMEVVEEDFAPYRPMN